MIINYGLTPDYTKINVASLTQERIVLVGEDGNGGEKKDNQNLIDSFTATIVSLGDRAQVTSLGERVESLLVRNHNIDLKVRQIDEQIANYNKTPAEVEGHEQFIKDSTKIYDDLNAQIPTYKEAMNEVYVKNAQVSFANSNVLDVTKSMSLVFSILIPLAAGLVVGIIVNLIVDRKMLYEEEEPVAAQ